MKTDTEVAISKNAKSKAYMSDGLSDPVRKSINEHTGGHSTTFGPGDVEGAGELCSNYPNPYGGKGK